MPKALHDKAKAICHNYNLTGDKFNACVYGYMRKHGWKPAREKKKRLLKKKR
jgi:hypothetical protein